jgi:hypothetical protein
VFADEKLLYNTALEKPLVMQVYDKLVDCGVIHKQAYPPKTKEELFEMIEHGEPLQQNLGFKRMSS